MTVRNTDPKVTRFMVPTAPLGGTQYGTQPPMTTKWWRSMRTFDDNRFCNIEIQIPSFGLKYTLPPPPPKRNIEVQIPGINLKFTPANWALVLERLC